MRGRKDEMEETGVKRQRLEMEKETEKRSGRKHGEGFW